MLISLFPLSSHEAFDVTAGIFPHWCHKRIHQIDLIHTFGSISDFSGVVAGKIREGTPVINGSIRSARTPSQYEGPSQQNVHEVRRLGGGKFGWPG
jgi:hypothetical protein